MKYEIEIIEINDIAQDDLYKLSTYPVQGMYLVNKLQYVLVTNVCQYIMKVNFDLLLKPIVTIAAPQYKEKEQLSTGVSEDFVLKALALVINKEQFKELI